MELGNKTSTSVLSDLLPPAKVHPLKVPQPSQQETPAWGPDVQTHEPMGGLSQSAPQKARAEPDRCMPQPSLPLSDPPCPSSLTALLPCLWQQPSAALALVPSDWIHF